MSFFIRKDPLTAEQRIVASVRSRRPHMFRETPSEEPLQCPFCEGNESLTPQESLRLTEGNRWLVRVIPNKFPAIPGLHDVVVDSPEHGDDIDTIPHLDKLLWVYQQRLRFYYEKKGIKYVAVFRNRGERAGASIPHPHSQVLALPFYPERYKKEINNYKRSGKDLLGEFLKEELKLQERVLTVSDSFVVLVAYAPVTPYELWIVPKNPISSFIFERELEELAQVLKDAVISLKGVLGHSLPYNITFQSAPPREDSYRYYIRVIPRVAVFGGFEMETENIIVSVAPEEAVIELRTLKYLKEADKVDR